MMQFISVSEVEKENYKILSGSILPRPIALVSTLQENGKVNLAPFSYFNIVSSSPPLLSVSVRYDTSKQKDTSRNIFREKEFVVHIISEEFLEKANKTSISLSEEESELDYAGFHPAKSKHLRVPGISQARIRLECVYEQHLSFETTDLIIGRVVGYWIDEDIFMDGKINLEKLKPVSRLSGSRYGLLGDIVPLAKEK
jgi:flavin reductase (DIM6/NTAB) family NADH-FMN oxidoreductase RutF